MKKEISGFLWNTIGSILVSFNSVIFLFIITRINGLEDAGVFSICMATAYILYVFAIYSGRNCHITDIKGEIKDKDYIISRIITCILTVILAICYILIAGYDKYKGLILLCLSVWKATEALSDVFYGVLQKNGRLDKVRKVYDDKINYRYYSIFHNYVLYP